ncbi:hypothetical protein N0V83_002072 [Neocucurbitaria cava]|uniref:Uncharacterized protein n=1 Tax=Neocucurbitaria cava TaxID=798079 RepID=A0A9W9CQG8_9PLEO|nr:hypothetical protein N0V83_002072 [Neocucurbitaria cava]
MLDADGEVKGIVEAMGDPVANVTGELVEPDDPSVKGKLLEADNMLDGRLEKKGGETVVVTVDIRELNESAPEFNPLVIDGSRTVVVGALMVELGLDVAPVVLSIDRGLVSLGLDVGVLALDVAVLKRPVNLDVSRPLTDEGSVEGPDKVGEIPGVASDSLGLVNVGISEEPAICVVDLDDRLEPIGKKDEEELALFDDPDNPGLVTDNDRGIVVRPPVLGADNEDASVDRIVRPEVMPVIVVVSAMEMLVIAEVPDPADGFGKEIVNPPLPSVVIAVDVTDMLGAGVVSGVRPLSRVVGVPMSVVVPPPGIVLVKVISVVDVIGVA